MTFSFIVTRRLEMGDAKVVYGTFANDGGSTGGTIETNLRTIENFVITYIKSAIVADIPTVNGTLETAGEKKIIPLTGTAGSIPIVTTANTIGFWTAFGE
jgi:hypothetical protein